VPNQLRRRLFVHARPGATELDAGNGADVFNPATASAIALKKAINPRGA
jgi:hypothetical protein